MKKRRDFLKLGVHTLSVFTASNIFLGCGGSTPSSTPNPNPTPDPDPTPNPNPTPTSCTPASLQLLPANSDGLMLPEGFTSRIVASSSTQPLSSSSYIWHSAPDGGATFSVPGGGWVYVSNSERDSDEGGGVGALKFDENGTLIDSYSILSNTNRNCAGGATPWGTWLSCEETSNGQVYECDPMGIDAAQVLPELGTFTHEAVAVDPATNILYLTEDRSNGRFYRFTPTVPNVGGRAELTSGTLEVMQVTGGGIEGSVTWLVVPDPSGVTASTRTQVPESTAFAGGEGVAYDQGKIYFVTKGDNRVWCLDIATQDLSLIYDGDNPATPASILNDVDNVVIGPNSEVLVAEDGGDMKLVVFRESEVFPLVQVAGHGSSEVTGPAFTPDFNRLYFSSQRGSTGSSSAGITFEVTGPFSEIMDRPLTCPPV